MKSVLIQLFAAVLLKDSHLLRLPAATSFPYQRNQMFPPVVSRTREVYVRVSFGLTEPSCLCVVGSGRCSNSGIRELPAELAQLSNLWQLDIENLPITNVPQDTRKEGIKCRNALLTVLPSFQGKVEVSLWVIFTQLVSEPAETDHACRYDWWLDTNTLQQATSGGSGKPPTGPRGLRGTSDTFQKLLSCWWRRAEHS